MVRPLAASSYGGALFAALFLAACRSEDALVVLTIEDPAARAQGAATLALGSNLDALLEERALEGRAFPVSLLLTAGDEVSGLLFVEARTSSGALLARGAGDVSFDVSRTQAQTVRLERACATARDCTDGLFCTGEERCERGLCQEGDPACGTLPELCVRAECLEEERACRVSYAPDIDDGDPCTEDRCTGVEITHRFDEGRTCLIEGAETLCREGRCGFCGDGLLDLATEACDPPGDACVACQLPDLEARGLAAGGLTTCAIRGDARVWCWGTAAGRLGHAAEPNARTPTAIARLGEVDALALGHHFGCAIERAGPIQCWGTNVEGQLGVGEIDTQETFFEPRPVAWAGVAESIAAGTVHACAVEAGEVFCWGRNEEGQAGGGDAPALTVPTRVLGLDDVAAVAPGSSHTCALRRDGTVWCWGARLGADGLDRAPTPVPGLVDVTALASGDRHACVIRRDGGVWCWGANASGQLGVRTTEALEVPALVPGLARALHLSAGEAHTCAIDASGHALCWGRNFWGQLGDGTVFDRSTPARVMGPESLTHLSVGGEHTCAAVEAGPAWCWGKNLEGQVGRGPSVSPLPVRVVSP